MKIRNRILELVTDEDLKEDLYKKLKADYPIFFTRHQREMPDFGNVYEYDGVKIVVEPKVRQQEYVDFRLLELYDDLDANLNDYADKLLALPKSHAISHLEGTLTQYDAEEVYDYLINARKLGELHDLAEFKEVQRYFDRENGIGIQTYLFFYKGEFKSFGCTIQTEDPSSTKTILYDQSEDYEKAMQYFRNESPIGCVYLIDYLRNKGNQKNNNKEME